MINKDSILATDKSPEELMELHREAKLDINKEYYADFLIKKGFDYDEETETWKKPIATLKAPPTRFETSGKPSSAGLVGRSALRDTIRGS